MSSKNGKTSENVHNVKVFTVRQGWDSRKRAASLGVQVSPEFWQLPARERRKQAGELVAAAKVWLNELSAVARRASGHKGA